MNEGISTDHAWKLFQRACMHRERARLIRIGTIVPAYRMKPQMMVMTADGWKAEIKTHD